MESMIKSIVKEKVSTIMDRFELRIESFEK